MKQEEIDILWQKAMQESIKDGEMYTRYRFAKLVAEKALSEHAMRKVQRLGQEIEQEPVAIVHRNEYNEYRLEPHDNFDIKSIQFNVDVLLFKKHDTPPQRTWVNPPDEEIKILWIQYRAALPRYLCFAKALLSRAKEKNT